MHLLHIFYPGISFLKLVTTLPWLISLYGSATRSFAHMHSFGDRIASLRTIDATATVA